MSLSAKNLVDLNKVYIANDVTTLRHMLQHYQFHETVLRSMMYFAVHAGHVDLLQDLQLRGVELEYNFINTAFGHGDLDMCRYLYCQGHRVRLENVYLREGAYAGSADDVLSFAREMDINVMDFCMALVKSIGNFSLCLEVVPKLQRNYNLQTLAYYALTHNRHDVMQQIMQYHALDDDLWQVIIETGIRTRCHGLLLQASRYVKILKNIQDIFIMAYDYGNFPVLKTLIMKYDPNFTYREIHLKYWPKILAADVELVEIFVDKIGWSKLRLSVNDIYDWSNQETAAYLRSQGIITDSMLDRLLMLAIEASIANKIRVYYALGAKPDRMLIRDIVTGNRHISFDVITAVLSLGVDLDFGANLNVAERQILRQKHIPKLTLNIPQGLAWLAATCYRRHYELLPKADMIPVDVMHLLLMAKYQYE